MIVIISNYVVEWLVCCTSSQHTRVRPPVARHRLCLYSNRHNSSQILAYFEPNLNLIWPILKGFNFPTPNTYLKPSELWENKPFKIGQNEVWLEIGKKKKIIILCIPSMTNLLNFGLYCAKP